MEDRIGENAATEDDTTERERERQRERDVDAKDTRKRETTAPGEATSLCHNQILSLSILHRITPGASRRKDSFLFPHNPGPPPFIVWRWRKGTDTARAFPISFCPSYFFGFLLLLFAAFRCSFGEKAS